LQSEEHKTPAARNQSNGLVTQRLAGDIFNKSNLARLGILAFYFVLIDSIQSYYLGKVLVNQYVELNLIPAKFYSLGVIGVVAYFPIEFLVTFGAFVVLWATGSFMLWYFRAILRKRPN
jgi:hypothetical protein